MPSCTSLSWQHHELVHLQKAIRELSARSNEGDDVRAKASSVAACFINAGCTESRAECSNKCAEVVSQTFPKVAYPTIVGAEDDGQDALNQGVSPNSHHPLVFHTDTCVDEEDLEAQIQEQLEKIRLFMENAFARQLKMDEGDGMLPQRADSAKNPRQPCVACLRRRSLCTIEPCGHQCLCSRLSEAHMSSIKLLFVFRLGIS